MTSITKILILIIAITAISGEVLNLSNDVDRSSAQVSDHDLLDMPESMDLAVGPLVRPPFTRPGKKCDVIVGIYGCITSDGSIIYPFYRDIKPKGDFIDNMKFGSKHGSRRVRRQALVKTKGSDDGPDSVMSFLARSSSPLRYMIRNRSRRSPSIPETSSTKNTTKEALPALGSNLPAKLSYDQRFLIMLLMSLTSPYHLIVPNQDYIDESDKIYYS